MSYILSSIKSQRVNSILAIFKNDIVFSLSLVLALVSCFIATPKASYIDFKVLICLFNLMLVIKAFEDLNLLDKVAVFILNKCTNSRSVSLILILLSFFMSMLVTNDIALITLVPLALIISRKSNINMLTTVIFQTLAANIGGSLTPMGNPQNLFIFSHYKLTAMEFFPPLIPFTVLGLIWLIALNYRNNNTTLKINLKRIKISSNIKALIWMFLFIFIIFSVFNIINYKYAIIVTVIITIILNKKLLYKIDYLLLITFVCFFIFIGNISSLPLINNYMKSSLSTGTSTYFSSVFLSQFISNVPCAIFLSKFTTQWKELLIGVNIGGLGTIIASLASVISYKLFIKEKPAEGKRYLLQFTIYNFLSLGVFTILNYLLFLYI